MMNKKIIIISIAALIFIIGGTVGALYLLRQPSNSVNNEETPVENKEPIYVVDTSKDYGACTYLEKSRIKQALGDAAANLQGPDNAGRAGRVDTVKDAPVAIVRMDSQTCVYSFVTGGNVKNGFNANNGFSLIASQLEAQSDYEQLLANYNDDTFYEKVADLGDAAFFKALTSESYDVSSFELVVLQSLKAYTFTIFQPRDATTFTAETAKQALQTLAASKNE